MNRRTFLASSLPLLAVEPAEAQQPTSPEVYSFNKYEVLKGIKEIKVVAYSESEDLKKRGLSVDDLQAKVELRLRESGVNVVEKTSAESIGLYIGIEGFQTTAALYCFIVNVSAKDSVRLMHTENTIAILVPLWMQSTYGVVEAKNISSLKDRAVSLAERFLNDYWKANPKK